MGVGPLGELRIMPSGGILPDNLNSWLDAGAFSVGMGSKLVGGDLRCGEKEREKNTKSWKEEGRDKAKQLFDRVHQL